MYDFNLQKAIKWNPFYARETGWVRRHQQVLKELGFTDRCPDERQFAVAVYLWQRRHPALKADGMLGPGTWRILKLQTSYKIDTHVSMSIPDFTRKPNPSTPKPDPLENIWFGLGGSYGGHFIAIGKTSGHFVLISATDFENRFTLNTENWRFGPGLGGSWGLSFMLITSLSSPSHMKSHTSEKGDAQFSVGGKWLQLSKELKHYPTVRKIASTIREAKKIKDSKDEISSILSIPDVVTALSHEEWVNLKEYVKVLVEATGMKTDASTPQMQTVGIPMPYSALEISAYWGFSNYSVSY